MPEEPPISPAESEDERHPVDVLAEEFAERCRSGEHVSVSDYANRYPEHADQLRELLPSIALMEKLKRRNRSLSGGRAEAPLKLQRLGDFRILREVGRGGMGIVYEAQQESLGRHVALKVLSRASLLDPQRVQRFEREAKAAANLHHTNIVPVFGVGEAEGLHYYAMQFIEGRSIAELLTDLAGGENHPGTPSRTSGRSGSSDAPSAARPAAVTAEPPTGKKYWRWVADLGRQVAEALEYAHRQGTLHRDVKPANLLVDERGNVWITDFGLAKLGEEFNQVTRTGDLVGTLQYMAPESLRSQTDARSDIYGLGITLYELITLRPAFDEPNPAALMRRVAEGEPAPPRKFNPHVPHDLETIVLKAIARDPAARYRTAAELAEDLENFLHDRPINARRISAPERVWRWCRRNRAVAALTATAVAFALAALIVGWTAYGVTRRALSAEATRRTEAVTARQRAEDLQQKAEAAQKRADANVALSLKGFEDIFNQIAPEDDLPPPMPRQREDRFDGPPGRGDPQGRGGPGGRGNGRENEQQDAAVIKSILTFYNDFVAQNPSSRPLHAEAAKAYRRVGDSYYHLGDTGDADAAYRHSAELFAELLRTEPESPEFRGGYVEAVIRLGVDGDKTDADVVDMIHRAAGYAAKLAEDTTAHHRELLARVLLREGNVERKLGNNPVAEDCYKRSIAAWESAAPPKPPQGGRRPPPRPPEGYAAHLALAELYLDANRTDDAKASVHRAADELDFLWDNSPLNVRRQISGAYLKLSTVAQRLNDTAIVARAKNHEALGQQGQGQGQSPRNGGRPPPGFPPPHDGPPPE